MSDDKGVQVREAGSPYKLIDHNRENKKGIIASSLKQLINTARVRFDLPKDANVTIVLEEDGTEIDDEEYFATLEQNTNLMILHGSQKWSTAGSRKSIPRVIVVDDTDHGGKGRCIKSYEEIKCSSSQIGSLVSSLQSEPAQISLLPGTDLEMLSDMDPDSVADIVSDKLFLEQLKEASGRFLAEKRTAQESMTLLQMLSYKSEMKQA